MQHHGVIYDSTLESLEPKCQEPRRSGKSTKEPLWLQDYIAKKKAHRMTLYPISDYLSYNKLSMKCKSFMAKISALTKPQSFTKASRDKRQVEAMQQEGKAFEDNKTWEIVDMSKGKTQLDQNRYTR